MDTTNWLSIICGWAEVKHYITRHPSARIVVQADGNGAVRVLVPTLDALNEFIA